MRRDSSLPLPVLLLCVEWDRPDGQTVHTKAKSRIGFGLIPVGVAGEGFSKSVEVSNRRRKRSGCSGVTWRADGMFCEIAHRVVST